MRKRLSSSIVISLLINTLLFVQPASAKTGPETEARRGEKVRAAVARLGSGPDSRVEVRLRDKTKLAGYVSRISDDSFAVTQLKTGQTTTVTYTTVTQIKGHNLSTGAKIAIGVGIAVGVLLILVLIGLHYAD